MLLMLVFFVSKTKANQLSYRNILLLNLNLRTLGFLFTDRTTSHSFTFPLEASFRKIPPIRLLTYSSSAGVKSMFCPFTIIGTTVS